ncbi:MAG: hypothetical protein JJU08_03045 [Rhodobacteraceae bacterium]|nr:hypothetical protein [Paracoccaceae bacterium]
MVIVPMSCGQGAARRLEERDALRDRMGAAIGGDPRHRWLTIAFTTGPDRAG